jgi:hypothetical protein
MIWTFKEAIGVTRAMVMRLIASALHLPCPMTVIRMIAVGLFWMMTISVIGVGDVAMDIHLPLIALEGVSRKSILLPRSIS